MPTIVFESNALALLASVGWIIVAGWLITIAFTLYGLSRHKRLLPTNQLGLIESDAPLVSVLVPARNEQHRVLADCIRSILAQDYGSFEVVAVNDRSTDATGAILESLARADGRMRVIEGEEPPPGWLGKAYAMHQALNQARGEWILATDADMIFDKTALRTAVRSRKSGLETCCEHSCAWQRISPTAFMWFR